MGVTLHLRVYKALARHSSLQTRIYFAAFSTLLTVSVYLLYSLYAQHRLTVITRDIMDNRLEAMRTASNVKLSFVSYDDVLFRYLSTKDKDRLHEIHEWKNTAHAEIKHLRELSSSPLLQTRLDELDRESQRYFADVDRLILFLTRNRLPANAGVWKAAAWARDQGVKNQRLSFLSAEERRRLDHIFSLCDQLVTTNRLELEKAKSEMIQTLKHGRHTAVGGGALTGVLVLLIAIGLALSLLGPLQALLEGVQQVEEGHMDFEIPVTRMDEIGQLTSAFNRMTRKIRLQREQLFNESITDSLTGIYNHRHFLTLLRQECDRARRSNQPLSLLMVDIDHFKQHNDTQGHESGNELLKRVCGNIRENLREIDILARYGGDELSVILPNTSPSDAQALAAKLQEFVQLTSFSNGKKVPPGHITISIGGASFPQDALSPDDLIAKADEALYAAKMAGRDCVRWASSTLPAKKPA